MALTPDDVVTKQFQHVRFKEGFDPDEVDDFLDEIVVEWRKTIAENEELKAKLAAVGDAPASSSGDEAPASVEAPAASEEPAEIVVEKEPETVVDEVPSSQDSPSSTAPVAASAGIIELAQRLHDEHVAEGKAQRDKLIAEAQAHATKIVADAEDEQRVVTERLEGERTALEGRITELRQFERDYRSQLRSYIEGKLRDLETTAATSGTTPVSAIGL